MYDAKAFFDMWAETYKPGARTQDWSGTETKIALRRPYTCNDFYKQYDSETKTNSIILTL